MLRPIVLATAISGTLDILFATVLTLLYGRAPADMLRFVASGPFPGATDWGAAGALVGLIVHFFLMGIMAAAFVAVARRLPNLSRASTLRWGVLYGLITYALMNLLIIPLRFPGAFPPAPLSVATQLFAHIALVGIPFAVITARSLHKRPTLTR